MVRGGDHVQHSTVFKELVTLACNLGLDSLPCSTETYMWCSFRYSLRHPNSGYGKLTIDTFTLAYNLNGTNH